jgi:MYXO-CTERM domain-containing protein
MGTHSAGGSYDRHLYSNYLGNNPGNQGRNFAGCTLVKNPFQGPTNPSPYFVAHALTGKSPEFLERPELKPSSYVTLVPLGSTLGTSRRGLTAEVNSDGAGCSAVTGGANEGALVVLALIGFMVIRRRRGN